MKSWIGLVIIMNSFALFASVAAYGDLEVNSEPLAALTNARSVTGIVSAGSTFKDLSKKSAKVSVIGSASLVIDKASGKTVVLTAAHVVGGERPWVEIDGKKIWVKEMLVDNDSDVAVLGVGRVQAPPAFQFSLAGDTLRITPDLLKSIDDGRASMVTLAFYLPAHALGFALRPWVDPGTETALARGVQHAPVVSMNHDGSQIRIFTKVTSGASGSAVFDLREQNVVGLVTQSHYYLSETYLASAEVLLNSLKLYRAGSRGTLSETKWKMRNGLEYRTFSDGREETTFANRPTSGVLGKSGNGTIGQPARGTAKGFRAWTESPQAVFEHFQIKPGIYENGRAVIGYRADINSSLGDFPQTLSLYAESEALRFERLHKSEVRFTPLFLGETDFTKLLRERLNSGGEKIESKASYGPSALADDMETTNAPDRCVLSVEGSEVHVRLKIYSHMNRTTWKLVEDEIEFTLNDHGALDKQTEFLPVVSVAGKSGELYYVDLRQFYFADISQLMRPMPDWSEENAPFDKTRFEKARQLRTVGLSIRNANSGAEFTYGFLASPGSTNRPSDGLSIR